MLHANPEEAPALSVTQTPGLASADQLVDATENELFSFQQGTSETGEFLIVFRPFHEGEQREARPLVEAQGRAVPVERLRVKLIKEDDGRITMSSPQLDIASFGKTELEAWEAFLSALEDVRRFYFENRSTLSPRLREKLRILETPYVLEME